MSVLYSDSLLWRFLAVCGFVQVACQGFLVRDTCVGVLVGGAVFLLSTLEDLGCFSGCLMSSASIQKLFCGIYSVFKCSFDEFFGEKVFSPSYSSTILAPPLQYCSIKHWTLLLLPVTSTTGCCSCVGSVYSFFLELFLHWSPVAYWAPTNLGSSYFSVLSFCLFILFMGF